MNEPSTQQGCGVETEAILDGWNQNLWVPDPQRQFVGQASYANNTIFFLIFWTILYWNLSQKLQDVGAGAKKLRCPVLDPKPPILVPAPQPWYAEDLLALSLLCDVRYSTMKFMRTSRLLLRN